MSYNIQEVFEKYRVSPNVIKRLIVAGHIESPELQSNKSGYSIEDNDQFRKEMANIKRFFKLSGNADFYDSKINYDINASDGVYTRSDIAVLTGFTLRTIRLLENDRLLKPSVKIAKNKMLYIKSPALTLMIDLLCNVKKINGSPRATLSAYQFLEKNNY